MKNSSLPRFRLAILIVTIGLQFLLFIRLMVDFLHLDPTSFWVNLLLFPTAFIAVFFQSIVVGQTEVSTIFAMLFIVVLSYVVSKLVGAHEKDEPDYSTLEYIEAILRILEILLVFKALLMFVGADPALSPFVAFIYALTFWAEALFRPIVFSFGILDISALILLMGLLVLDRNTDRILGTFKIIKSGSKKSVELISGTATKVGSVSKFRRGSKEDTTSTSTTADQSDVKPFQEVPSTMNPEIMQGLKPSVSEMNSADQEALKNAGKSPTNGAAAEKAEEPKAPSTVTTPDPTAQAAAQTIIINLPTNPNEPTTSGQKVINITGDQVKIESSPDNTQQNQPMPTAAITLTPAPVAAAVPTPKKAPKAKTRHKDDPTAPEG